MRLSNKQKLSLNFALVVFLFYIIFALSFYFVIRIVLVNELRGDLVEEGKEIIRNHLSEDKGGIVFTKDPDGNFLKEELTDHGYSAIFLDNDFSLIRSFGLYEFYDDTDKGNLKVIAENLDRSKEAPFAETIKWKDKDMYSYFFPVVDDNGILAYGVVSVPLDHINLITRNILIVLIGLGALNFVVSVFLGIYLANRFLKPVKKLSSIVERIDLDKLDQNISVKGPSYDEFVVLTTKFKEMLDRLKSMSTQQRDFISNVSHELKTPLARAVSSIEVLRNAKDIDKSELELIKKDLFEINSMLENLYILSNLRRSTLKKGSNINIYSQIKSIKSMFDDDLMKKNIDLDLNVDKKMIINFPEDYFRVLISNLLSNAVKYSNRGATIYIRGFKNGNTNIIEINDEGAGMNDEQKMRIFERFYRGKDTKQLKGHGIGMSLVKQICDLYDIKIKVNSKKGKGTKVILIFPEL